jgi:hypothetical protein
VPVYPRDPDSVLDWHFDWSDWLAAGEAIISYQLFVPDELILGANSHDGTTVTVWLSGGAAQQWPYVVTCRIVTDQGRTDDRSIGLLTRNR